MEWLLDIALIVLLGATLFHALRLERALGVLRRDRSALEELVSGFNASTRQAELGIERLRGAADGAGKQIARQIDAAESLKDDLTFLTERGDRLADRLDKLVRAARQISPEPARPSQPEPPRSERRPEPRAETPYDQRSDAGADLGHAARVAELLRREVAQIDGARRPVLNLDEPTQDEPHDEPPGQEARPRSQAELDLLRALRLAR
jgi:hypothetical protein